MDNKKYFILKNSYLKFDCFGKISILPEHPLYCTDKKNKYSWINIPSLIHNETGMVKKKINTGIYIYIHDGIAYEFFSNAAIGPASYHFEPTDWEFPNAVTKLEEISIKLPGDENIEMFFEAPNTTASEFSQKVEQLKDYSYDMYEKVKGILDKQYYDARYYIELRRPEYDKKNQAEQYEKDCADWLNNYHKK